MKNKRTGYFGYDITSEFLDENMDDFLRYSVGQLVVSIGAGKLQTQFYNTLRMFAAYGLKNFEPHMLEPFIDDKTGNMTWDELFEFLLGLLVMSIGDTFYNQVYFSLHVAGAWAHRHDKGV